MRSTATNFLVFVTVATMARADTLREALVTTYRTNPTITAQRQTVRESDSEVAIARAASRPSISLTAGVNQDLTRTGGGSGRNAFSGLDIAYPVFDGGSVRNSIRAAQARLDTSRYVLLAVEGDTLVEAVTAYMDVIRDRAVVEFNRNNIDVLDINLSATRDLFRSGEVTRTDVAQSEARLALGRSQFVLAQGTLTGSEQNYGRVIGHPPSTLAPPPVLPTLPTTPDEAVQLALATSPRILAVSSEGRAAAFDVRAARGSRMPTLSAFGSGRYTDYLGTAVDQFGPFARNRTSSIGIGIGARIPLYQGGLPAARIREAQAAQGRQQEQSIGTERSVVAATRAAFADYVSALSAIASNQVAVSANMLALDGARAERKVGTRSVLDVLNAQQELLNAEVQLVSARRDAYVAGFRLLNAMGQTQASTLGLEGGPLYDPLAMSPTVGRHAVDREGVPGPVPATRSLSGPDDLPALARSLGSVATESSSEWGIQLGAFAKLASAEALMQTLPHEALAGKTPTLNEGPGVVRVQVGPFNTRDEALAACTRIAARGWKCFVRRWGMRGNR